MSSRRGRPFGDVSLALLSAAAQGPGTVRELAQRAQVGFGVARVKVSHLVRAGTLVPLTDERPRTLALPVEAQPPADAATTDAFELLARSFWYRKEKES